MRQSARSRSSVVASARSATTSRSAGTACRWPYTRLSSTTTSWPRASSRRTVWLPMYPAPPVTRIRMRLFLQAPDQERPESGLNEMTIRSQCLFEPALLHDDHGNAIDKRPFLVGAGRKERQTSAEQGPG